jgi:hypothetical protein
MDRKTISIAKDFTETPVGRYITDGPYSGEAFRENLLFPTLSSGATVEVDLNGALGYGSSFLEEAFGGLIREKGMSLRDLKNRLIITSDRKFYIERVWRYLSDADAKTKR